MSMLVLEHGRSAGIGRLGRCLIEHGHRLDVRRVWDGDGLPTDLRESDGVIVMGGPESVAGSDPAWFGDECAMLRTAVQRGVPVVGICLGCQVLARALGGQVGTLATRRFGWHPVRLTVDGREDPLLAGLPWTFDALHHNADIVSALPGDAVLLATGPDDDVQAWRLGNTVWAFQFHPEVTIGAIDTWCREDAAQLAQAGGDASTLHAESCARFDGYRRRTDRLFKAIAMLLMPLDARPAMRP